MPTLEDILKLTKDKGSINIVPLSKGQALTQEEIQAMNNGINNYLSPMSNPDALIKDPKTNTTIDTSNIQSKTLYDALHAPNATPSIESIVQSKKTIDFNPDVKDEEDISDQLARYDFPLYAETDDLNEARAYNAQSNTEAMIKGAKNIIPVAIGVGAQMLGGTMQIANNMLGDDDFDNPITKWGRDYMKNNMNIIYQNPNGNATSNAKSLIAAGSDILGQFGSAIGSMIAMSPANAALIKSSVGLGSAVGGPMGGILGGIAGSIAAAAMNAYAEGVIDAADVYDKKYKELWNKTHNMNETQKVAKLAAQTVANQNMILNTALNIIPVMWSVKPYGLDKSIKNALGLPEVESKWFRLQKPYAPNKLATETFDEYADRIAKIKASGFANNEQYSLLSNPFDTLKNIGTYGKQTANSLKYNALHPIEYLNRNWDIIGETVGEGLEEYHNYFAREQGLAVNKEEDAAMIPSMSKLMKGYSDMITKGEGAYDLIAGSIIGGMSAPIMSGFHFGRTKVYNPDNGQMEYKYKRNPALDWIPFELASDHDQKDYENVITNSLQRINDVKSLGQSYLNAQTIEEKDKVVNQLLLAPLTKYVDDGSFETFMLSLEAMKENLGSLAGSEDQIGNYLSVMDKLRYDAAMSNLENETDPKKIASLNTEISVYKDKARKAMSDHSSMLTKRIDFLKSTAEDYRKLKDDISANYGNEDYGYANALFKNKMAFEIEQDMLKKHHQNLENVRTQFKNKIQSQNPSISEGEVYQIMDDAIKNDKNPIYKTDVENYINAKKALLESEFRMERFAQRYLSLATWGYKNEADLRRELELIEEISAFSMTDDEIRSIRDNDNDQNMLMLSNFIDMLEMQLQAETDPAKKKQIQDQLNMFKQLMGNFDSNTNDALKKYLRFKSIQQELRDLMKNQVTYELDFKNNEYNYKGFTPLQKYLARNKMMADEFKKMSKAKNDIDILNTEVISVYKQYADRYSDAFTEEQKSLQAITQEFEKLRYNGVIDMTQMNDVNQWLQNHDTIYKEVRDRLLATAHKYSQPGFENPFIANYIKNIIIQMNYQKDVIDQLRQLQFQYELQLTIATSDEIIDLLNKGIITHRQAINYVNESKSITDNEKNTLKEIIAKAEEGIIHNITIRAEGYVPIAYYNNNDEILINDGQEIIYESKNDGTVSKTRKNTYSGLDTVTDKDISHYTRFDPETPIDESRLKTDIKYLSTMLRFRESLSPKDSDTLIKFINTKEFIDFIVDNIVKKDINISKTIKVILANIADIDRTSGSDDRKIIYTHAQQELLRVYLYKGDNDLEKIILLGSKNDNSSIENIDKVKFMTLFNSPTTNILSQLKSIDGYQYYHVIDIIKNKSLYKVIDGKLLYFAHPLAYQYLDNPEDMKKIGDFLKDVTTDNIENKITQLNSQISSNFKIVVINPDTNTNDIYTINSEGKLNKETTAELANKGFFDKDLYDATKPKIPSKSLKEQVLDIIKNNKVNSANINTIADDLDNITDINEVNRYIKSDSRADNYPQYLWLLYKLSDPTYFNPHLYVQLKMHHEKINDNFKQTDIYNKIKTIYEDTITSHDTEVLVHDEQGIIYTIDSVSKIIEDNSILQQPTTSNQSEIETKKADIERRRQEELNQQTDAGYSIIALDYLFTGGRDVILSTDYLLQALVGGFTYSAKEINDIRNKYADKLGNIKDDINSDVYNQMMNEIRDVINKNYNDSKATEIFDKILKNATGFTNREGNQTSIELDKLNEQNESKINAKYDEELAKELYKEMLNGKSIADMTPYEKTVANTYITADLKRSVDAELSANEKSEPVSKLKEGEFYTDVETYNKKSKTEKEVLDNIRAYYYNLVKNSPLINTQEQRDAALETIKRLPDLEMLVQFVRKLYTNIREADYTPTKGNPFDDNIDEITGKATKDNFANLKDNEDIIVLNQSGWHYRQIVGVKKDPTKYRFSLNVWGNKELIKILDNIARKYGIYYKTPNSSDRWNDRHDPVTIYVSNSSLTDAQIDALKREIVEETKPYIRSNDGFGIYGENLSKGVEFGLESTQEEVNRILTEADSVNPTLGQAIRTYLKKRTDGQYKSSVGQNLAIIKAINLFKSISQPTETILPPKIYYTNKGALYSIDQQGMIEEVKSHNVSKLMGTPITNEAHIKLLTALKSKKLSQPFKLKQKTSNKKILADVEDIAKTTFTNRLNPNDKISVEKTSNNDVHLLDYNGELSEFIPFINHDYDNEFYETLSYYYESKAKQISPEDKEDPNQKIVEKLEQEYDKYDFSKLDRTTPEFKGKLRGIVNEDSAIFKSIIQGEVIAVRTTGRNIKHGDPMTTIFDLYRTGLITGKDIDDIKKQLDKFVVLFEKPVQQKIERADIADKKRLLEEQVLKFSKKTRVNYFYTNGNYIAFVKFPNDADVNGKNFIETTDSGPIEWEFISYDKLDTFLDTNAHDTSKKYYFDLNDLLNNEEFLYKLFKYKYNYLSLDTSYDLFNKHVAEIIFNILDDNIKSKLATKLVDEVLTTVDTMSLDSVKAIMVGQRIKDTDNYQVWFYTKRKDGQKISFFNEIGNINKNGRIKVKIDESREVILSNDKNDLIAKVLSGELRLSINNNIKSTRLNSLQINYAIQRHSSLDIATDTNYREFKGVPSNIRLEFEDVRKNGKPIGWKLYYKEDSYIELIQNEGRRFKAIEFRLKTKEWRQYTSYKQGDIFPFNWDEFDNFFKEVYDNLPDTFTIKELYQALFYGINKGTEFNLLLSKLKKHSDVQDDQELFKMLLIDAAQYMDSREYIVSLNGFKMIDYEARTLSKQILDEIDRHTTINDMIDNIKFVKGTSPDKITSVNNTNTVDEGEDFNESEYQKAYGQKEELVLAETAVAHSHRLKSEYTYNEFPESFNQIDSEVTLIANYNKSAVAERNESTRKILTQYSDIKSGMVIIDSTSLSGLKLTYKGSVYDINSKADYINLLEEIFDDNKNNSRFLKSERLLDILYMYDISVDERGNITGIKSKSNIIAHSNKDGRNSAISQYWNGLNSGEKDNALLLLKKLFVISRMQLAINYKNTNDEYEYLGYMHDLPYLLDPYRSISLFNETIFREPNEQLEAELSYVMNSFNKKIEIFNLLTDINQSVPVSFNFDNYGKLNTLNNTREVLAITLLKDTYQKYYISKQNINDLYNFVLFNLADSSKNIEELYTLKKIDFFNYMYLIILPIINKLNTNNTQTNEEYFWNTFVKPKVKDINEKNFATKSGKINYIALLQSIYETPNVLSNANRKTIEHEVLSKLISTDEDNNNYKRALLNYTVIELFNPFSNKSRFYTASNITLENGTKDIFNSDTVKDSTLLDQLSAKLQVKNQVLNNVLEGAKNIILSYINNTVSNNIFNNNVLTSDDDKLTHLRNIFKTIRLRLDSNKFDDDEQILLQLSNYKGNIGSLFIVSNKKGDEERDKLVIAYKDKNTYELIIIDKNAIVHKVYDMTEKSAKSGDISKIFNKKSEIALTRTDDKITSLLKKVYLVVDGSLPEIKSNAKINDSLSSTPITKYHEYVDYIFDTNINGIEGHYFIHPVIAIEDNVPTESDITTITSPSVDNDAIVNQQGISTIYEQLPNDLKAKAMAIFNPDSADSRLYSNSDYNKLLTELYDEFIKYQSSNNMLERQNIAVNILDIIIDINELNNDLNRC